MGKVLKETLVKIFWQGRELLRGEPKNTLAAGDRCDSHVKFIFIILRISFT
jgi:hypothetical protein